ncbi:MAG TPA: TIGR01777 family oxidoreductase [Gemmatimonadales bacterium]|nr:TIGR01777 family oxidoreductase [Gemmatimonadales bacterium]
MKTVVSGSTGLIGSALVEALRQRGDEVIALVRRRPDAGEPAIAWDPERGSIDCAALERAGADTVIHLAGENVFGRWSPAKKNRIRDSRVLGTRLLTDGLAGLARPPATLLAASAIGYYGDRGEEELTEQSAPGEDFLAHVSRDWEAATAPAARAGIRVVNMRMGVVLTTTGGALAKMLPAFRLGLGGPIGSGNQYVSWIAISDAIAAILHVLVHADLVGPVNMTAPHPVSSREFARTLGKVLGRPAVVTVPAFALRVAFGPDGAAMLQSGQRVLPARLRASGFTFSLEALAPTLRYLLAPSERAR